MYQLITIPGSCSTGIHVLLNKLNIPVEVIKRDDIDNYPALVPTNQVPALKDGESLLTEGAAIVLYLVNKHGVDLSNYGGATKFNQWLMFNYATLHPAYGRIFAVSRLISESDANKQLMTALALKVEETWNIVEKHLEKSRYMTGDNVCVIDYLLAIYASWGNYFPDLAIKLGPNVKKLIADVSTHTVFTEAYAKEGATFGLPSNA